MLGRSARPDFREMQPWLAVAVGLVAMYAPTIYDLSTTLWGSSDQGHAPIILALTCWLLWRKWPDLSALHGAGPSKTSQLTGLMVVLVAGLIYAVGRSQRIPLLELGSLIPAVAGAVLSLRGPRQLRTIWFPLFFMIFMLPVPGALVDAITQPMKMGVSIVAEHLLHWVGYPVARSGVVLQVGVYQLLVADACAGLHTLFTLEALGLLYLNLVRTASVVRNIGLAILIVPISFTANVIRVCVLCLITYHFGDEAGQGFMHGFAGMVLFVSALALIIFFDSIFRLGAGGFAAGAK
jgi:exosortase B